MRGSRVSRLWPVEAGFCRPIDEASLQIQENTYLAFWPSQTFMTQVPQNSCHEGYVITVMFHSKCEFAILWHTILGALCLTYQACGTECTNQIVLAFCLGRGICGRRSKSPTGWAQDWQRRRHLRTHHQGQMRLLLDRRIPKEVPKDHELNRSVDLYNYIIYINCTYNI